METLLGVWRPRSWYPFTCSHARFSEFHIKPAENAIKQILYDISVQNERHYVAATFAWEETEIY